MVAYVIIPGIDGSDSQHWQSLWEQEWGRAAARIAPTSWSRPDVADWVRSVERAVERATTNDEDVILIAHSLGCWAAAAWLGETERHVQGAFLVAPPDREGAMFPASAAPSFLDVRAQTLPCTHGRGQHERPVRRDRDSRRTGPRVGQHAERRRRARAHQHGQPARHVGSRTTPAASPGRALTSRGDSGKHRTVPLAPDEMLCGAVVQDGASRRVFARTEGSRRW